MRKILRRSDIRAITGLSDRTIDRRESLGEFPTRIRLGRNAIGWYSDEVEDYLNGLERGGCDAPGAHGSANGAAA